MLRVLLNSIWRTDKDFNLSTLIIGCLENNFIIISILYVLYHFQTFLIIKIAFYDKEVKHKNSTGADVCIDISYCLGTGNHCTENAQPCIRSFANYWNFKGDR